MEVCRPKSCKMHLSVVHNVLMLCPSASSSTFHVMERCAINRKHNGFGSYQLRTGLLVDFPSSHRVQPCATPQTRYGNYGQHGHIYPHTWDRLYHIPLYVGYGRCGQLLDLNRTEEVEGSNPSRSTPNMGVNASINPIYTAKTPLRCGVFCHLCNAYATRLFLCPENILDNARCYLVLESIFLDCLD